MQSCFRTLVTNGRVVSELKVAYAEFYQKVSGICRFFIRKFVAFEEFYQKVSDICKVLL